MKRSISFITLILFLLVGCAGQTIVKPEGEFKIPGNKTAALLVTTLIPDNSKDIEKLELLLTDKLRNAHIFSNVMEKNQNADLLIKVEIEEFAKVSKSERFWYGAMAGRAKMAGKISLIEASTGKPLGSFHIENISSGGTVFAGTTEEVIDKFAEEVINFMLTHFVN